VLGLLIYAGSGYILLTRVRLPSTLHLIVYAMAAGVLIITLIDIELAVAGLAMMIPFARPGFTVPVMGGELIHFSGLNVAIVGVWLVFLFRYMTDRDVANRGPLLRRTPLDFPLGAFLILALISTLHALNLNDNSPLFQARNLVYMKEQVMYVTWFYLIVTMLRKPEDVRRFAIFFAISGIFVAMIGLHARITGALEQVGPHITEAEIRGGVAGGRTSGVGEGGWFGLGHPNLYAAFLLMTLPVWFFGVEHLKQKLARPLANLGVLLGFVALLYTYARSGWGGMLIGMGILGLRQPRLLRKLVLFLVIFAVAAQILTLAMVGVGVAEVLAMRFEQLEASGLSARPEIFAGAAKLAMRYPLLGVGLGAFKNHAVTTKLTFRVEHGHSVFLSFASELGFPCTIFFITVMVMVARMAWLNLRARHVPGYGFVAQGGFVGFIGILLLMQFDYIFFDRVVGFALYGLIGIIVSFHRMLREGMVPGYEEGEQGAIALPPSRLWINE
jgi:putative inorganic carbon (HCO3(-)) transporter